MVDAIPLPFEPEGARLPLRNREGEVIAFATIDKADLALVGGIRWAFTSNGYVQGWPQGRSGGQVLLHRYLLGLQPGDPRQGDHRNRNRLDNRRSNLRVATPAQNSQNTPRPRGNAYPAGDRWIAQVMLGRRNIHLGTFDTQAEAQEVAAAWRRQHMPFAVEEGDG
jgi:hypothetical protein